MNLDEIVINYRSPIEVMEKKGGKAYLKGTFIRLDIPTTNGRIYRFEEGQQIAREALGKPVYVFSNITGHIKNKSHEIGKIIKAWLDKPSKSIKGIVEVWNTHKFPSIVEEVRTRWGFSIGGRAQFMQFLARGSRLFMRAINFSINHLQLLRPQVQADLGAYVESVNVQESIGFSRNPWLVANFDLADQMKIKIKGRGIKRVIYNES